MTDLVIIAGVFLMLLGVAGLVFAAGYFGHALWDRVIDTDPPCKHEVTSDMRWTQDGWVKVCLVCRDWLYFGDGEHPTP